MKKIARTLWAILAAGAVALAAGSCDTAVDEKEWAEETPTTWYSFNSSGNGTSTAKWTFATDTSSIGVNEVSWEGNEIKPDSGTGATLVGLNALGIKYVAPSGTATAAMGESTGRIQASNKTASLSDPTTGPALKLTTTAQTNITVRAAGAGAATSARLVVITDADGKTLVAKNNLASGSIFAFHVQGAPAGEYNIYFNGSTIYEIDTNATGNDVSKPVAFKKQGDIKIVSGNYISASVNSADYSKKKDGEITASASAIEDLDLDWSTIIPTSTYDDYVVTSDAKKTSGAKFTTLTSKLAWDSVKYVAYSSTYISASDAVKGYKEYEVVTGGVTVEGSEETLTSAVKESMAFNYYSEYETQTVEGLVGTVLLALVDTTSVDANGVPNKIITADAEWTSSNEKVATVSKGIVTAVGEGTATIQARVGRFYDRVTVKVTKPAHTLVTVFNESSIPKSSTKISAMTADEKSALKKTKVSGLASPLVEMVNDSVEVEYGSEVPEAESGDNRVSKGPGVGMSYKSSSTESKNGAKFVTFKFTVKPASGKSPKLDGVTGLLNCGKGNKVLGAYAYINGEKKGSALNITKNNLVPYNNIGTAATDKNKVTNGSQDVGDFGTGVAISGETEIDLVVEVIAKDDDKYSISLQIQDIGLTFTE